MLNNGKRELCYTVKVDGIEPIVGSDNCEAAIVRGWKILVRKGTFKKGDVAIYFEIDSMVDSKNPIFKFLEKNHYHVKTQRYTFGGKGKFISQGLLMPISDFELSKPKWLKKIYKNGKAVSGIFLTNDLKVSHIEDEKQPNIEIFKAHSKYNQNDYLQFLFLKYNPEINELYLKSKCFKFFLSFMFRHLLTKKSINNLKLLSWPNWVQKTDEERVQNLPELFPPDSNEIWSATEKIDGSSATFTLKRKNIIEKKLLFGCIIIQKYYPFTNFKICSRNLVVPETQINSNYLKIESQYNIKGVLEDLLEKNPTWSFVTLQGEIIGNDIGSRKYKIDSPHKFFVFNLIVNDENIENQKRFGTKEMQEILKPYNIPCVPLVIEKTNLPKTMNEILELANGKSVIDDGPREGLVFRTLDGVKSFKVVSNQYLTRKGKK